MADVPESERGVAVSSEGREEVLNAFFDDFLFFSVALRNPCPETPISVF